MTIGEFLLRRLEEAGVGHLFGVPGDFNLELLQQLEDTGTLTWVGTCNELNASYAADGYARLNGLAAFTVTNAVGALGAINGVAGSYAEHVPVICIAGSIPLRSIERGLGMHHTMGDGTWDRFLGAFAQVTAAQARLTPHNAVTEIDRLILTAWRDKLPVYLELPSDIAYLDIEVPAAPLLLAQPPSDPERLQSCAAAIAARLSRRHVTGHLGGSGRGPVRRRGRGHGAGRENAAARGSDRPGQGGDRRDVPVLRRHLQRQGQPAVHHRGHRGKRLPAVHRLPADRRDLRRLHRRRCPPARSTPAGTPSTSARITTRR